MVCGFLFFEKDTLSMMANLYKCLHYHQPIDIREVVGTAVLTLHLPCLFILPLHSQAQRLQAIAMIDGIESLHQLGTPRTILNRIEEVGLIRMKRFDVTHDDTRLLISDAIMVYRCQDRQCRLGNLHRIRSRRN